MTNYSEKDIPLINLWVQLKTLSEDELQVALSLLDEDARELIMAILIENKWS